MSNMDNQIDLDDIEWVINGERANETNLNRPLKQFLAKVNTINTQIDAGFADLEEILGSFSSAVVLKGTWSPASGVFPIDAKIGWSWIASDSAIIDGIDFQVNDRLLCISETPGDTYEGSWLKLDYSDHVTSVNDMTGSVKITADNVPGLGTLSKLNYGSSPVEFRDNSENDGRYIQKDGNKKLSDENFTLQNKVRLETIKDQEPVDWFSVAGHTQVLNKPTNLSDFTNDIGFITEEQASGSDWLASSGPTQILNKPTELSRFNNDLAPSDWSVTFGPAQIINKPTEVSYFNNDAGYLREQDLQKSNWDAEDGPTQIVNKPKSLSQFENNLPNANWLATFGPTQILNKPTDLNQFENSSGFLKEANIPNSDWDAIDGVSLILNKPTALSDFNNDLAKPNWNAVNGPTQILNKPTDLNQFENRSGFIKRSEVVKSDWLANSGPGQILNKPSLGSVASLNQGQGDTDIRNNLENDNRYTTNAARLLRDKDLNYVFDPGVYSQSIGELTAGNNYPEETPGLLRVYSLDSINELKDSVFSYREDNFVIINIDDIEDAEYITFDFADTIPNFKLIKDDTFGYFESALIQSQMQALGITIEKQFNWSVKFEDLDSVTPNFSVLISAFGPLGNIGWKEVSVEKLQDFSLTLEQGFGVTLDIYNNKVVDLSAATVIVNTHTIELSTSPEFGYFKTEAIQDEFTERGLYASYNEDAGVWSCSFNDVFDPDLGVDSILSEITNDTKFKVELTDLFDNTYGPKEICLSDNLEEAVSDDSIEQVYFTADSIYLRLYDNKTQTWCQWNKLGSKDFVQRIIPIKTSSSITESDLSSVQVLTSATSVQTGLPIGWNCKIVAKGVDVIMNLGTEKAIETNLSTFKVYKNGSAEMIKITETEWLVYSNRLILATEDN